MTCCTLLTSFNLAFMCLSNQVCHVTIEKLDWEVKHFYDYAVCVIFIYFKLAVLSTRIKNVCYVIQVEVNCNNQHTQKQNAKHLTQINYSWLKENETMYIHPPTEREKEGAKEERKKREGMRTER